MIPKPERTMARHEIIKTSLRKRDDDLGVSEVLGVIMMLAMVLSIMGGIWIFLNPYISDFEDNTNWNSANGIADRIEDRVAVVGDAPEGTGARQNVALKTSILQGVSNIEQWEFSADLTPTDVISITTVNSSKFIIKAQNRTAAKVVIETTSESYTESFSANAEDVEIEHNLSLGEYYAITVFDETDTPLHKKLYYSISGMRIITSLGNGEHEIYLVNNARIEHFADSAWEISKFPKLEFDELASGELRLSIVLTNIIVNGSLGTSNHVGLEFISVGALNPYRSLCYNIQFTVSNSVSTVVNPQYDEAWLNPYVMNRASGTLDEFIGLAPFERASGADGITVKSNGSPIQFDVSIQQVEVKK